MKIQSEFILHFHAAFKNYAMFGLNFTHYQKWILWAGQFYWQFAETKLRYCIYKHQVSIAQEEIKSCTHLVLN